MPQVQPNVKLLRYTPAPEELVALAGKLCYSASDLDDLGAGIAEKDQSKYLGRLMDMGHLSPIEHASFTFGIEGVSRSLLAQITRHRIAMDVTDIEASAKLIHSYGLPFILDNTTATPFMVRGIDLGADIIINSSSKYINGSSNSISGVITDSGNFKWSAEKYPVMKDYIKFGKFAFSAKLRNDTYRNFGCCLSPMNAFFNTLGLETLGLRMERHCQNALRLAEILEPKDGVKEVNYPLLITSPYYGTAKKQFGDNGGGIFTIRLYTKERAFAFINRLKYAVNITNIGDTKTLVIHPSSTIYAHSSTEEQEKAGVYEDLIRVSVGIEDIRDLIEDFKQALEYINSEFPINKEKKE